LLQRTVVFLFEKNITKKLLTVISNPCRPLQPSPETFFYHQIFVKIEYRMLLLKSLEKICILKLFCFGSVWSKIGKNRRFFLFSFECRFFIFQVFKTIFSAVIALSPMISELFEFLKNLEPFLSYYKNKI